VNFTSCLENFNTALWSYHIKVPDAIAKGFIEGNDRRVVCTLNETVEFQCALMPQGERGFFILVNKKIRDQLKLKEGMTVQVSLKKDESEYGLPMPEELKELMELDTEGHRLFHALTSGKQRNLLFIIGSAKTTDTRLKRAVVVIEHLKKNEGKINFKLLNEDLKDANNSMRF
jgi:hypothetical protein